MQIQRSLFFVSRHKILFVIGVFLVLTLVLAGSVHAAGGDKTQHGRLVTFHDRGERRTVLTHAQTIEDALGAAKITITKDDVVEPRLDTELVATDYAVNIYRARPVVVVDGSIRQKIMTAAQTPRGVAAAAGITLQDEDIAKLLPSSDIVRDSAATVLTIHRATRFTLQLYGTSTTAYSQASSIGEMLAQKGVKLAPSDTISVDVQAPLVTDMTVTVWREGVQTATVEESIDYPTRIVQDADRPIGYRAIEISGIKGKKNVVYEITAQAGREIGRKAIQSVVTLEPKEQIEVVGVKPGPHALTKSKGAQIFVDSKGVSHRETYYDLPMNIVMGACGGGVYTIRADGAKVDKDGYILVAAHLGNYPRCSIVETSMGLGKVYDTGGFAAKHPHGFDLATDWTKADGR